MKSQAPLDVFKKGFMESVPEQAPVIIEPSGEKLGNSDILSQIIKPGEKAPDFSLNNTLKNKISLSDLLRYGPVVLSFFRGRWCPFGNMELNALQEILGEFRALNATLVAISPQPVEYNLAIQQEKNLLFEILSDPGNTITKSYNILYKLPEAFRQVYMQFSHNFSMVNNDEPWILPLASRFIIDQEQIIRYAKTTTYHTIRSETEETLAALKTL
jgi:peroxiredoxin